jgi:hypothetical protein
MLIHQISLSEGDGFDAPFFGSSDVATLSSSFLLAHGRHIVVRSIAIFCPTVFLIHAALSDCQ